MTLRLQLEALLRDFPLRKVDGWWPFDHDTDDYKEGAIDAEAFWRTKIRHCLDATSEKDET